MPSDNVKGTQTTKPTTTRKFISVEQNFLALTKTQNLKQLGIGSFTVTRQIKNTIYEIREDANRENIKTTQ